ncbi:related to FAD carrier protein FLX1 [Melanopsichium pennsylvanicum]|uniref:Related to FAD carrier protein FLX1 n=2 Tax=Melanopsichium pennsylvanicum TaxID=63383 RepID=A0AAJ4XQJ9_9BASI|nr:related to FAD carrier protein FLX1 [Melanopsichium pennsylvanicum 4]SNX86587.1 related to FAD carrier protein FLX1 [Melanopsichium pennsylvanicum]
MSNTNSEAGPSRPKISSTDTARLKLGSTDVANSAGSDAGASRTAASTSIVAAKTPSFFPTPALDHAFGGIVAGAAATICMNPLDLIKTKYQVDTSRPRPLSFRQQVSSLASSSSSSSSSSAAAAGAAGVDVKGKARALDSTRTLQNTPAVRHGFRYYALGGRIGNDMISSLNGIVKADGWRGLYRGLSPNVAGNSASWGLYFLWYTMIKERMSANQVITEDGPKRLSAGQHLLAASESGAITALMTNPIWVVKTRMFTTPRSVAFSAAAQASGRPSPEVYRGLWHGLVSIYKTEGVRGWYKGAGLALFGVSNGAIQFMAYEELKRWRTSVAARKVVTCPGEEHVDTNMIKLSNAEYIVMSGVSKVAAILLTYPYQVVRSRIQNHATSHIYPDIQTCIRLTYTQEGLRAFYKGLVPNLVRILPGTCVTFVVYENVSWVLKGLARRRIQRQQSDTQAIETSTSR